MTRRNWKLKRPTSMPEALRMGKDFAREEHNRSVERMADFMGVSHDSQYKWIATGRLPAILIPSFEQACGYHFVTEWLATSAGKLLIDMPKGRKGSPADVLDVNTSCAAALQLLTNFYANPNPADADATLAALRAHMEQVAYHQHNVASYANPELEF